MEENCINYRIHYYMKKINTIIDYYHYCDEAKGMNLLLLLSLLLRIILVSTTHTHTDKHIHCKN